jgi:mxaC protein
MGAGGGARVIDFEHGAWLLLLPLALLPLWRRAPDGASTTPWLALVPHDTPSLVVDWVLRVAAALAVGATLLALAGPFRGETRVERIGRGAEIVFVFDRSSSMDDHMVNRGGRRLSTGSADENAKATVARRIIARFVREREHDAFALVLFSAQPIAFLPFTQKAEVMLSAIEASSIGRGLGNTDIGSALLAGAALFDDRPYLGSRILVLVSDGGAQLDEVARSRIATELKRHRVGVYWIYLRGAYGRPLLLDGSASAEETASIAEQSLHDYFSQLGLPYRPYEADKPEAVQRAIDDLAHSEQQPIVYTERLPRRDFTAAWTLTALAAVLLLWAARMVTLQR